MTLSDRLRALMALDDVGVADAASEFFRDHGPDLLRALEDAERYRWLRGGPDVPPHSARWPRWEVREWNGVHWETLFAEKMDAAIDQSRQS